MGNQNMEEMEDIKDGKDSATFAHLESLDKMELKSDSYALGEQIMEEERHMTLGVAIKYHWRTLIFCMAAFTVGMAFGYDTVVNGASISMPAFVLYYGKIDSSGPYLPSVWTSLWTAMSSLAQVLGGFIIGFAADKFGRKWTTVVSAAFTIIGTGIQFQSITRGALLGGKLINGLGIGAILASGTSYASEISPISLRGHVQSCLVLFTMAMQMISIGVIRSYVPNIAETSFRHVFAIQWAVGGMVMVAFALIPESPVYLINQSRIPQAHAAMSRLYGSNNNIEARVAYLTKVIQDEQAERKLHHGSYADCFKGTNLKRTLTICFVFAAIGTNGGTFLQQSIYFLTTAGLPTINAFDVSIGGFGLAIIFIIISWFIMDKIGRRIIFLSGSGLNIVCMFIIGGLYYVKGTGPLWAIAVIMNVLISWQSVCLLANGWVIVAELPSYRLRAKTLAIGVCSYAFFTWLYTFIVPYIYNVDSGDLGARTGFVFGASGLIYFIVSFFIIPDTQGMKMDEIDWLYESGVPVRKFQSELARRNESEI